MLSRQIETLSLLVGLAHEAVTVRENSNDPEDTEAVVAAHRQTVKAGEAMLAGLRGQYMLPVFRSALAFWDEDNPNRGRGARSVRPLRRALFAAWWCIENVSDDAPDRTDVFFELRTIVRDAQS